MNQLSEQDKKIIEIKAREEEAFVARAAGRFDISYVNLVETSIETDALITVEEKDARKALVAPFKIAGKDLYVAVKSPRFAETNEILENLSKKFNVGIFLVSTRSLEHAWERYADVSHATRSLDGMLDISEEELEDLEDAFSSNASIAKEIQDSMKDGSNKKVSHIMETIFGGAISTHSSDVHMEAAEDDVRIRFRQDGILQDITSLDKETYKKILSRIKLLSKMKLTSQQRAQDGRFTIEVADVEIEVRVSVIPSAYGESFVIRILNPDGINVGIESLGIEPKLYEILMKEIKKPNGMILTTGPTGSGKTTTLYSVLRKVYSPEVKILTIEDPIEYHLDGISQTQINKEKGYTFLNGLRAALRQDPDIVMVGEIRDAETAKIAVNASLTGHLVLSTLHTNSAAGVIPRLIDLGVSPQILAASLSVSLAQRLVRKLCVHCSVQRDATESEYALLRAIYDEAISFGKKMSDYGVEDNDAYTISEPQGCVKCNNTGYKGRIGIFEAIITDEDIEELLNKKPSEQDLRIAARKQPLLEMKQDALVKILEGTTTLSEVEKVVDMDVDLSQSKKAPKKEPSKPVSREHTIFHQGRPSPSSVIENHSDEIALLGDYLLVLEQQQLLNPNESAQNKIKEIKESILHLLQEDLGSLVPAHRQDEEHLHKKHFEKVTDHLEVLEKEQEKNPELSMADQIRKIRQDILSGPIKK